MDEPSIILVASLFCGITALAILFYRFYSKYTDLREDKSKWVTLMDLDGGILRIGKFAGYSTKNKKFSVKVICPEEKNQVREWVINLDSRYTYNNVSRDYAPPDRKALEHSAGYKTLVIFTDFNRSDLDRQVIQPLATDVNIVKLGWTEGLDAITSKHNPICKQNEILKKALSAREDEILATQIENYNERLEFLQKNREAYKAVLGVMGGEYIRAPELLQANMLEDQEKYSAKLKKYIRKEMPSAAESLETESPPVKEELPAKEEEIPDATLPSTPTATLKKSKISYH